ncbi:MAG: extracellular solute-binding protein [Microgenomates group bacterium]
MDNLNQKSPFFNLDSSDNLKQPITENSSDLEKPMNNLPPSEEKSPFSEENLSPNDSNSEQTTNSASFSSEQSPISSPEEGTGFSNNSLITPQSSKLRKILLILGGIFFILLIFFLSFKFILPRFQKQKQITLTYWGLWEPETVMNAIIADWEKENPNIKVNYIQQNHREYRERLQSALAREEGPDIFRFHLTWVPMLKNELEPIPSTVMTASEFEQSFYPVITENLRYQTGFLGIPLMVDTLALFYNEDIFLAAGKVPPKNWQELRQVALDLTIKDEEGRIQTAGVALGTTNNVDHWSDILGLMMLQNGVDLTNPGFCYKKQKEVCLGEDALNFYTIFYRVDRVWDETLPSSTQAFAAGKLAMYFGPSWRVFDIKAINPKLNFKIIPVPQISENEVNWATFWVEGVAKKSKYKQEAFKFLKFLSSPSTLEKLYQAESNLRLFGEIYPRKEMAEKLKDNPFVAPFLEQITTAKTWWLCSFTWDNGINDRMIKYFEDAVNAVNQGKTAKEALETTTQGIGQLLSQYGISTSVIR